MSENNSMNNHNDYCEFCGNKISTELSKKIKENKEDVVCELCGCQLLLITNISKEENRGTELITDIKKEHQEDIREELKELYGLNIYSADREKFGYYLTIFTSRSIYNIIKQYNLGINITDIQIEMISNSIIVEIINNRVNNEWLAEFKPIKKKFKKCYRELQSELSLNQALHEVFLEFFRLLTKIIINLINKKDYSELQVIEYDIAEYLIKRDLFVSNIRLTVPFRYNLKICLSRLIYLRIKDIASKNKLKFRQLKLPNIEYRNISDEIMKYLITHNEIINNFLGELESIKTDDFNEFYEYLCLELKSDNLFAESFNYYLRWLIGHVHNIVSGKYKWRELSHFDRIIGSKLAQLINVEVDFEKIKEFKENVQNAIEIPQENPVNLKKKLKGPIDDLLANVYAVLEHIKKIVNLIKCTNEQRAILLSKSKKILNRHILRVKNGKITISKKADPLTNAVAIIYSALKSSNYTNLVSLKQLSEISNVRNSTISKQYSRWYKDQEDQKGDKNPQIWIKIKNKNKSEIYLKDIFDKLKKRIPEITYKKIGLVIDGNFRGYIEGHKMNEYVFKNLKDYMLSNLDKKFLLNLFKKHLNSSYISKQELINKFNNDVIPHLIFIGKSQYIPLQKNKLTSAFIGVMLGDGGLLKDGYTSKITLNGIDEPHYVTYVKEKILDKIFIEYPFKFVDIQDTKAIKFINNNSSVHYAIRELGKGTMTKGFVAGDKVKNQVNVPEWVFENLSFVRECLKNLFDTDGSISVGYGGFILRFPSSSKPLAYDYYNMCKLLGIKKVKEPFQSQRNSWEVIIQALSSIKKFLRIVNPEKFKEPTRRKWLGLNILLINAPYFVQNMVKKNIENWKLSKNKTTHFQYSFENTKFLNKWLEKYYNNYLRQFKSFNIFLKMANEVNLYLKESTRSFKITKELINKLIDFGLTEDRYSGISILKNKDLLYRFPKKIRNHISHVIYNTLKLNVNLAEDSIIDNVISKILKNCYPAIYNLLKYLRYNIVLIDFFKFLIKIIREFVKRQNDPHLKDEATAHHIISYFRENNKEKWEYPKLNWKTVNSIFKDLMKKN